MTLSARASSEGRDCEAEGLRQPHVFIQRFSRSIARRLCGLALQRLCQLFEQRSQLTAIARRAVEIPIWAYHCDRARMCGEPLTIGAVNIFEGIGGRLRRNHRDLSADGLPCISMGDRQGVEHVGFTATMHQPGPTMSSKRAS